MRKVTKTNIKDLFVIFNESLMFPLVLLRIIGDSLYYISSRHDPGENRFHRENRKNLPFLWHCLLRLL